MTPGVQLPWKNLPTAVGKCLDTSLGNLHAPTYWGKKEDPFSIYLWNHYSLEKDENI